MAHRSKEHSPNLTSTWTKGQDFKYFRGPGTGKECPTRKQSLSFEAKGVGTFALRYSGLWGISKPFWNCCTCGLYLQDITNIMTLAGLPRTAEIFSSIGYGCRRRKWQQAGYVALRHPVRGATVSAWVSLTLFQTLAAAKRR